MPSINLSAEQIYIVTWVINLPAKETGKSKTKSTAIGDEKTTEQEKAHKILVRKFRFFRILLVVSGLVCSLCISRPILAHYGLSD